MSRHWAPPPQHIHGDMIPVRQNSPSQNTPTGKLYPLRRRRRCDLLPAGEADGEIRAESVHCFFHGLHRLALVLAVCSHTWQIDELSQHAGDGTGRELRGINQTGTSFPPRQVVLSVSTTQPLSSPRIPRISRGLALRPFRRATQLARSCQLATCRKTRSLHQPSHPRRFPASATVCPWTQCQCSLVAVGTGR